MTMAIVCALLALHPALNPPPSTNTQDPFRGSGETVAPKLNYNSSGMTLEALHGLPLTRPSYTASQPQVWYYQPYSAAYPSNSSGMGGYLPPGTGRSHSPLALGFGWGWWW